MVFVSTDATPQRASIAAHPGVVNVTAVKTATASDNDHSTPQSCAVVFSGDLNIAWYDDVFTEDVSDSSGVARYNISITSSSLGGNTSTSSVDVVVEPATLMLSAPDDASSPTVTLRRVRQKWVALAQSMLDSLRLSGRQFVVVDITVCVSAVNAAGLASQRVCADTMSLVAGTSTARQAWLRVLTARALVVGDYSRPCLLMVTCAGDELVPFASGTLCIRP